jgi:hypothetical protein
MFVDCTGHGHLGELAGAVTQTTETGHMGTSNMWYWQPSESAPVWPKTPWALPLVENTDFPKTQPSKSQIGSVRFQKGEWFWESGFDQHPIRDVEKIRDWNLRAVFGAFSAIRSNPDTAAAKLMWVSAVGGTRESRRLEGDVILDRDDIVKRKEFPDGCVPTTWDIDLHYPKKQYMEKFPKDPFISRAEFGSGVDRKNGYPVPYHCFYSKNVPNLFMAGRCISVTHEALGTVRVMRTCGMMGEVVGKAAYVAIKHRESPRDVYEKHLAELIELLKQPAEMRRGAITAPLIIDAELASRKRTAYGPPTGENPRHGNGTAEYIAAKDLPGVVVDDVQAKLEGPWTPGEGLPDYVGDCYFYTGANSAGIARYELKAPKSGRYELRMSWTPHENRSTKTPLTVEGATEGTQELKLNQQEPAKHPHGFHTIGTWTFSADKPIVVTITAKGANGTVHADCVQLLPVN